MEAIELLKNKFGVSQKYLYELKDGDEIFENKGVKIVCDIRSLLYLMGTTLDFSDGINGKGFQFINPNATRTCCCGESFAI